MFTASITPQNTDQAGKAHIDDKGRAHVVVIYTDQDDPTRTVTEHEFFQESGTAQDLDAELDRRIRNTLARLNGSEAWVGKLASGPRDPGAAPTPPAPPAPTQFEIDKAIYFKEASVLDGLLAALKRGDLKDDDADLAAQRAKVKTLYKPEYFGVEKA